VLVDLEQKMEYFKFLVLVHTLIFQWLDAHVDNVETWEEWEWFVLPSVDVI
jgi:hypothetical protein